MLNSMTSHRIQKYLAREMSQQEITDFKLEIESSPALKKAVMQYTLEGRGSIESRIEQAIKDASPISPPQLTWRDRIRFYYYEHKLLFLGSTLMLIITIMLLGVGQFLHSKSEIIAELQIDPPCIGNAGTSEYRELLDKASGFFCGTLPGGLDSLSALTQVKMASFNPAQLYLGHYYLKHKDYTKAVNVLGDCYKNRKELTPYSLTKDITTLEFNLLLAKYGNGTNSKSIIKGLGPLKKKAVDRPLLLEKIIQFESMLNNPLGALRQK